MSFLSSLSVRNSRFSFVLVQVRLTETFLRRHVSFLFLHFPTVSGAASPLDPRGRGRSPRPRLRPSDDTPEGVGLYGVLTGRIPLYEVFEFPFFGF